jgi:membrane-associated PAP2 superfamily phosphatase
MPEAERWKPEALLLLLIAALVTPLFALTRVDLRVSALFYRPGSGPDAWPSGAWPLGQEAPWRWLDHAAPRLAAVLALIGVACLVAGWRSARERRSFWNPRGRLILLVLALGPGLAINIAGKNVWKRPRPHRTAEFGGHYAYVPPLVPGPHGRSFPSGDASIGFAYGVFYYAARRRNPKVARAALAGSIALGLMIGFERIATGAHFVSDVVWAGLLTWAVILLVYYAIIAIPRREAGGAEARRAVSSRRMIGRSGERRAHSANPARRRRTRSGPGEDVRHLPPESPGVSLEGPEPRGVRRGRVEKRRVQPAAAEGRITKGRH